MSSPTLTKTLAYVAGDWVAIAASGNAVPGISGSLTGKHVWARQTLATTDTEVTPTLSSLKIAVNEILLRATAQLTARGQKSTTAAPTLTAVAAGTTSGHQKTPTLTAVSAVTAAGAKIAEQAPTLTALASTFSDGEKVSFFLISPADTTSGLTKPVTLTWTAVVEATHYRLEIAETADTTFASPVKSELLETNEYSITDLPAAWYRWRVRYRT